jgi:hypothetical protein
MATFLGLHCPGEAPTAEEQQRPPECHRRAAIPSWGLGVAGSEIPATGISHIQFFRLPRRDLYTATPFLRLVCAPGWFARSPVCTACGVPMADIGDIGSRGLSEKGTGKKRARDVETGSCMDCMGAGNDFSLPGRLVGELSSNLGPVALGQ